MSSPAVRDDLVRLASTFLQQPAAVASNSLSNQEFLRGKGLNNHEIKAAYEACKYAYQNVLTDPRKHPSLGNNNINGADPPTPHLLNEMFPMKHHLAIIPFLPNSWLKVKTLCNVMVCLVGAYYACQYFYKRYAQPWLTGVPYKERRLDEMQRLRDEVVDEIKEMNQKLTQMHTEFVELGISFMNATSKTALDKSEVCQRLSQISTEITELKRMMVNKQSFPPMPETVVFTDLPAWQRKRVDPAAGTSTDSTSAGNAESTTLPAGSSVFGTPATGNSAATALATGSITATDLATTSSTAASSSAATALTAAAQPASDRRPLSTEGVSLSDRVAGATVAFGVGTEDVVAAATADTATSHQNCQLSADDSLSSHISDIISPDNTASVSPDNTASVSLDNSDSVSPNNYNSVSPDNSASIYHAKSANISPDNSTIISLVNSASISPDNSTIVSSVAPVSTSTDAPPTSSTSAVSSFSNCANTFATVSADIQPIICDTASSSTSSFAEIVSTLPKIPIY